MSNQIKNPQETLSQANDSRAEELQNIRIMIVDDHALFRQGLALLLRDLYPDAEIIEAADGKQALAAAERYDDYKLILLDLRLPEGSCFETMAQLSRQLPNSSIAIVSASDNIKDITDAYRAGAKGYIVKSSTSDVLRHALLLILSGETYIPSSAMGALTGAAQVASSFQVQAPENVPALTPRQREILLLMAHGMQNKDIANQLGMLEGTVKVHVKSILQKLGVNNRTHAVVTGIRLGLVPASIVLPDADK